MIGGALQSPIGWEDLLVDAAVIGGVERWERRLNGLDAELRLQSTELDENSAARSTAGRSNPASGKFGAIRDSAGAPVACPSRTTRSGASGWWRCRTWRKRRLRQPEPVLSILSELQSMGDVGPVALDEVIEALSDRLRFLRREPDPRRYGRVYVSSIEEARARTFDVVFLPGLAEGLFPRKMMEDPLLLDAHRWPPTHRAGRSCPP